uniref:Transporter 2, ATP binding cassette subfamily B member n=1 Tax=Sphenodon punctatus TaxID=8508 RepID=A0A8D0G9T4_SPHPU
MDSAQGSGRLETGYWGVWIQGRVSERTLVWRCVPWGRREHGALTLCSLPGETFIPYFTGRVIDILGNGYNSSTFSTAIFLMFLASFFRDHGHGGVESAPLPPLTVCSCCFTGDLTSRLSTDAAMMSRSVPANANIFLRSLVKALGLYGFMLGLSWRLTLLTLIESPLTMAAQKLYDARHQAVLRAIQDSMARSGEVVRECVSSIETVRSFATEEEEAGRYDAALAETHRLKNRRDLERAIYLLFRRLVLQVLMLYCGHRQIRDGIMTKGNLISFILYQGDVGIYVQVRESPNAGLYAARDPRQLNAAAANSCQDPLPSPLPALILVSSFQNVSFDLCPGEVTALVGLNGSGKSTCVGLLERFYEPQAGEVFLDGALIREYEHKYLHSQVALVGQEPVLFSGSIRENIAYGLDGCSKEEVTEAAREAHALGFISELEDGFETDVGEKGGQLSGGQKQRIAIARALIRRPKVLILDEATSALDVEMLCPRHRTVLVIAHRMQTVENADKIVVLEGGAVAEQGRHAELMEQKGPYYRLVQRGLEE